MDFVPVHACILSHKGKLVKYKKPVSNLVNINPKAFSGYVAIPAGAIGLVLASRGLLLTIGFKKDFTHPLHYEFSNNQVYDYIVAVFNYFSSFEIEKS